MAVPEAVAQRWNEMTKDEQEQAVSFIDFLLLRHRAPYKPKKTQFEFDALAGGLEYIAEDFDNTPEEFEEYM